MCLILVVAETQPKIHDKFQVFFRLLFTLVQMMAGPGGIQYLYFMPCYCSYLVFIFSAQFQPHVHRRDLEPLSSTGISIPN